MKVSDLMASADKIFATQTGRKLAKMFRAQGLAPTFSQFCSESLVADEVDTMTPFTRSGSNTSVI